jgi:putative DNA primase/helicase
MSQLNDSTEDAKSPAFDVLHELKELRIWAMYKLETKPNSALISKVPYQVRTDGLHIRAKNNDPTTWGEHKAAQVVLHTPGSGFDGVGFMLIKPFIGGDLDKCWEAETQTWNEAAMGYVRKLNSYTEISRSDTGLHVIAKGTLKRNREGNHDHDPIALWSTTKFMVLTENPLEGFNMEPQERTKEIQEVFEDLEAQAGKPASVTPYSLLHEIKKGEPHSDNDVWTSARHWAKDPKVSDLFRGNASGYQKSAGTGGDLSKADYSWALMVCRFTEDDEQVDRLYQRTGINHDEWKNERYRATTLKAVRDKLKGDEALAKTHEELTGYFNVDRFVRLWGDELRWIPELRAWAWWNGQTWEFDLSLEGLSSQLRVVETIRDMKLESVTTNDGNWKTKLEKWAIRQENQKATMEMVQGAKRFLQTRVNEFDQQPFLLNVLNGTIDLETGELLPFDRKNFLTQMVPVYYDPEATLPEWDNFINWITFGNEEMKSYIARVFGYCLTGDTKEEKLFLIWGDTRTGKSTLIEAIKSMMGEYAATTEFQTFLEKKGNSSGSASENVARLVGVRLVTASEVDPDKHLAPAMLKQQTGNDTITARFLYKGTFEFRPTYKIVLIANQTPYAPAKDEALFRRIDAIELHNQVAEEDQDKSLKKKLNDPSLGGPAVLAWAVRGCLDLLHNGGLRQPEAVKKATAEYRTRGSVLGPFIKEMFVTQEGERLQASLAHQTYLDWAVKNNALSMSQTKFGDLLKDAGIAKKKLGNYYYLNIRLRTEEERAADNEENEIIETK